MKAFFDSPLLVSDRWLELKLSETHSSLSWATVGGGWISTNKAYWLKVSNTDLSPDIIPEEFYRNRLAEIGEREEVLGFLTSASLLDHSISIAEEEEFSVRCISTVGLGNAVRIGDKVSNPGKIGTINLILQFSHALTFSASLEALTLATEARTLAVLEAEIQSIYGSKSATGTGTDCIGILSPLSGPAIDYTGKHTIFGSLIGRATYDSIRNGIENWRRSRILRNSFLSEKSNP